MILETLGYVMQETKVLAMHLLEERYQRAPPCDLMSC
jgi:hypothetical protein